MNETLTINQRIKRLEKGQSSGEEGKPGVHQRVRRRPRTLPVRRAVSDF
jgi:hypothetical protein